jgi:hypothetical protein
MKRELPKNTKLILAVAGLLVAAVAGYLLAVSPERSKASDLKQQVASSQAQLASLQAAARSHSPNQQVRVAEVSRLAKAMPTKPDIADVLLELNGISRATGIQFDSITPGSPTVGTGFTAVPIALIFQGSYYDLNDFLFRLRNLVRVSGGKLSASGRLYNVASVVFGQGKDKFPQVQATLNVNAYVYGPSAAPVAPTTTTPGATTTSTTTTSTTTTSTQPTPPPAGAAAAGTTGAIR